jgi:HD superfamily phosphohydrolase
MSSSWPKIIRDPVHDIIAFDDTPCDRLLLALINTAEFQRLRRIKQLGMSELVFPGANHSRFAHSIGVMHTARRFLDRLEKVSGGKLADEYRVAVLTASLLHDVGHGPFSHTFEKISGESHEARTLEIIAHSATEVHDRLVKHSKDLPGQLAAFFDEDLDEASRDAVIPSYLTEVVSSQLDADRFDYLLRDSYATGTGCGNFDLNWLIEHLYLDGEKKRFYLSHKGLMAAEEYVFARHHMYRTVYFHKTTRAAEVMLRLVLKRYKQLLEEAASPSKRKQVIPGAPPNVMAAFTGKMGLDQYLALDDHAISELLKACKIAEDSTLNALGTALIGRKLFKAVEASEAQPAAVGEFRAGAATILQGRGLDPDYSLVYDTPGDTPYEPYDPEETKPASQIYVETTLGAIHEISGQSKAVKQLTERYSLLRYYFPESIRPQIDALAQRTLKKEKK